MKKKRKKKQELTFSEVKLRERIKKLSKIEKAPEYQVRWERLHMSISKKYFRRYLTLSGLSLVTVDKILHNEYVNISTWKKFVDFINEPQLPGLGFKYIKQGDKLKVSDILIPLNIKAKTRIDGIDSIDETDLVRGKFR